MLSLQIKSIIKSAYKLNKDLYLNQFRNHQTIKRQTQHYNSIMSDQFEDANFDPIAYLNKRFPDEESLVGLDDEIQKLNKELAEVNQELIDEIHEHAMMNIEISEEIKKAKELSKQIISEIGIIKEKAKKSEQIVYDMCKDLKSLDIAKKNLTFSIDALKKFIMMVDAIEKLEVACTNKEYIEVANLLSAFHELSNHFKKYEQIPQIQQLYKHKNKMVEELYLQIMEDYEAFQNGTSILNENNMAATTRIVEVLGDQYFRKFIKELVSLILKQYEEQYGTPENSILQNTERRYGFIKRKMEDFNRKYENIIPKDWGVDCLLLYEFCSITRLHLTETLARTYDTVNVAVLMKSLQLSLKFQTKITDLMTKKYSESVKRENKNKHDLQALPKFEGSISNSFEPYLTPYIKSEEDSLLESITKSLQEDKLAEIKVYNSSIVLFHGIKNCIRRASTYSRGNLLLDILRIVKRVFRAYADKCFEKTKKFQGFQETVCWVINTAEYCKNIIEGVRESFELAIEERFAQNIDFTEEQEALSNLISKSIETLINSLDQQIEQNFSQISKMNWDKMEQIGDISIYVRYVKEILKGNFLKIKDEMEPLYLTLYVNKIVVLVANKFIQNIYKCKKLNDNAFQVLHMDIIELKETLLSMVKADQKTYNNPSNPKELQRYQAFVNKTFSKGQNIIKLMGLNNEQFVERYEMLMEGSSIQELEKILQVRGAKKTDFPQLVKSIQAKNL